MWYQLFKHTAQLVDEHNGRPGILCTLGTNDFVDTTKEEFDWSCGGPRSRISREELLWRGYLD